MKQSNECQSFLNLSCHNTCAFHRCKQWVMNVGNEALKQKFEEHPERMYDSYRVCEKHFTESSFTSFGSGKRLNQAAVPTLSLTEVILKHIVVSFGSR